MKTISVALDVPLLNKSPQNQESLISGLWAFSLILIEKVALLKVVLFLRSISWWNGKVRPTSHQQGVQTLLEEVYHKRYLETLTS